MDEVFTSMLGLFVYGLLVFTAGAIYGYHYGKMKMGGYRLCEKRRK